MGHILEGNYSIFPPNREAMWSLALYFTSNTSSAKSEWLGLVTLGPVIINPSSSSQTLTF